MGHGVKELQIELRKAGPKDEEDLLIWRNDPETRKASFSESVISPEEHHKWLEQALKAENKVLYIGFDQSQEKIGIVHFKIENQQAEININLAPEKRGKGYGALMIREASKRFFQEKNVSEVIAKIKKNNVSSIEAFQKAGFLITVDADIVVMALQKGKLE